LSNLAIVNPTFVADRHGTYAMQLIVDDGQVASRSATVVISTTNSKPVAAAGVDQSVQVGATVTLDGSASFDADRDPLTYRWAIISLPTDSRASLSDPTSVPPTFVADKAGLYVVQ